MAAAHKVNIISDCEFILTGIFTSLMLQLNLTYGFNILAPEKTMEAAETKQKMSKALITVNTAIKNLRLYPASSAKIKGIVEKIHQVFSEMLQAADPLILQKSEHGLLFGAEELKKPGEDIWQVDAFAKTLQEFGITNIIIEQSLSQEELTVFLEVLAKNRQDIKSVDDLRKALDQKKIDHIQVNKEIAPAGKSPAADNGRLLSPLDIADDKIIQFFLRANKETADEIHKIEQAAAKTDFLLKTFQSRLSDIMQPQTSFSVERVAQHMTGMISMMDKVTSFLEKSEREKIARQIGGAISAMGPDITAWLKKQNIDNLFGGTLAKCLFQETPREQAAESIFPDADIAAPAQSRLFAPPAESTQKNTSRPIMPTENFVKSAQRKTESVAPPQKQEAINPADQLKEKMRASLRDEKKPYFDEKLLADIPVIFDKLDAEKEHEMMALIISRLINNLTEKSEEIRSRSAAALADIIGLLAPERRMRLLERLSPQLAEWIKFETLSTAAYKKICNNLSDLIQNLIEEKRFGEALPTLDVFSCISSGIIDKNDKAHETALGIIRTLATEKNINLLLKVFNSSADNPELQLDAGSVLVRLGDLAMNRVLDVLRGKMNSDERVRIMRLFMGMGARAIPVIREKLRSPAPWYYLRNMAYIMGHVGNETSADALKPLLIHENKQLRSEALKGIYKTGGAQRAPILLEALSYADDQFKLDIVEALGNAKSAEAVPELLKMLVERKSVSPDVRADLEEKICVALGAIGAPEALPLLKKISGASFISRYAKKVKIAAGLAAVSINKRQEETRRRAEADRDAAGEKPVTELNIPLDEKDNLREQRLN